jgi:hypothetical protein
VVVDMMDGAAVETTIGEEEVGPSLSPCRRGDGRGPKSNRGPIFSIYITI